MSGWSINNKLIPAAYVREKIDILISLMIVLLELLTALLEYIDLILQLSFSSKNLYYRTNI